MLDLANLLSPRASGRALPGTRKAGAKKQQESQDFDPTGAITAPISVQEGSQSRRVSKIEGVVLRQLQGALKGNDRSAMAIIKMAIQMGFLEDPDGSAAENTALSASDERIL